MTHSQLEPKLGCQRLSCSDSAGRALLDVSILDETLNASSGSTQAYAFPYLLAGRNGSLVQASTRKVSKNFCENRLLGQRVLNYLRLQGSLFFYSNSTLLSQNGTSLWFSSPSSNAFAITPSIYQAGCATLGVSSDSVDAYAIMQPVTYYSPPYSTTSGMPIP